MTPPTMPEVPALSMGFTGRAIEAGQGAREYSEGVSIAEFPSRLNAGAVLVGVNKLRLMLALAYLQGRADEAATREAAK